MEDPQNPSGEIEFLCLRFGPIVSGIRSVTANDSASMSEYGGWKRILNTVDICNFMLQAIFVGGGEICGLLILSPYVAPHRH